MTKTLQVRMERLTSGRVSLVLIIHPLIHDFALADKLEPLVALHCNAFG